MKLATPDWKAGWLENRVSDRFFQEMARLDKSVVHHLGDTSRWCTQMAIELGNVAQPLQRLESGAPADGELKQAYERAIRLAALAAHLSVALHEAVTDPASGSRYPLHAAAPELAPARDRAGPTAQEPVESAVAVERRPEPPPQQAASVSPLRMQQAKGAPSAPHVDTPVHAPTETDWESSDMELPSDFSEADPASMQHTIRSLSSRGLSRGEIEIVTGQPRSVITEVLSQA